MKARTRFMIIEDFFWLQMFSSSVRVPRGKLFRFSLARSLFAVTFTIRSLSSIPRSIRTAYIWDRAENFPSSGAMQRAASIRDRFTRPWTPVGLPSGLPRLIGDYVLRRVPHIFTSAIPWQKYSRSFFLEPGAGNVRLKIFPGPRAQQRGGHRRQRVYNNWWNNKNRYTGEIIKHTIMGTSLIQLRIL